MPEWLFIVLLFGIGPAMAAGLLALNRWRRHRDDVAAWERGQEVRRRLRTASAPGVTHCHLARMGGERCGHFCGAVQCNGSTVPSGVDSVPAPLPASVEVLGPFADKWRVVLNIGTYTFHVGPEQASEQDARWSADTLRRMLAAAGIDGVDHLPGSGGN